MKSEKGVSLVSLIIYLIAMTITVGIVARISNYFYRNINILDTSLTSSEEFLNFNAYITKEVNIKGNEVQTIGEREISSGRMKYLIFSKTGNQYGFINNEIYLNQVKICSNLKLEEILKYLKNFSRKEKMLVELLAGTKVKWHLENVNQLGLNL